MDILGGNGFVIYFLREDFNILGLSLKSDSSGGGFWYLFDIEYNFVLELELYGIRAGGFWWMCYTLTRIHGTEFLRHWVVRSVHGGPETKITAPPPAQLDSAPLWVIMALLRRVQAFPTLVCVPRGHLGQVFQGAESLEVGLWRLYCPPVSCGGGKIDRLWTVHIHALVNVNHTSGLLINCQKLTGLWTVDTKN